MKAETAKKLLKLNYDLYEHEAQDFSDTRREIWEQPVIDFIKDIKPRSSVLDLGCGNGRLLSQIISRKLTQINKNSKPQSYSHIRKNMRIAYLGIDSSKKLIDSNRKKYNYSDATVGVNLRFKVGDGLKNPLFADQRATDKFDYVISLAVLHHIPSEKLQLQFLKNVYRSLKPHGQALISVWNRWQIKIKNKKSKIKNIDITSLYRDFDKNDTIVPWRQSGYFRFIHAFTPEEITNLATLSEFKNIHCFYADKFGKSTREKGLNIYLVASRG